ncbi:histone deacetylase family protein [Planctomicrobium piriforme]|uniref:Acetoin utilization deacetylase AcuC n=1 Tax=Planctomicrobium piriforme TaxID=1576369 RepID=A0A1I3LBW8_9PLAN|nr:histone deacetylase [Planctomicrobium piriforme]SFI82253.1 Acetoin utilization deacetylase AcuC [Planctomicrobium piriforme]
MRLFYTDEFVLPLPDGHKFPMSRYRLLRDRLVEQQIASPEQLFVPEAAEFSDLCRVHTTDYVTRIFAGELQPDEQRRIGFPWSTQMVERSRRSVGATLCAARYALRSGLGVNLAGGTHHAFADRGGGYCVFNDVAVTIRTLQAQGLIQRAVVIDCDIHQGDGTAALFAGDESVFTFSMHAQKAYPARKQQSDLDLPLLPGTGDADYLSALQQGLEQTWRHGPYDIAFYLAGADPFVGDRLGGLALTKSGLAERDRLVATSCREHQLPLVIAMAGGYADDVRDIVEIQARTIQIAGEVYNWDGREKDECGSS